MVGVDRNLRQRRFVVSEHPAFVGRYVVVRAEDNVDVPVGKSQARALVLPLNDELSGVVRSGVE